MTRNRHDKGAQRHLEVEKYVFTIVKGIIDFCAGLLCVPGTLLQSSEPVMSLSWLGRDLGGWYMALGPDRHD